MGMIKKLDEIVGASNIRIQDLRVNFAGTKVLIIVSAALLAKSAFYIWNIDEDQFLKYEFENQVEIISGSWEYSDPRFLGVYNIYSNKEGTLCKRISTFFVTKDHGIKKHDDIEVQTMESIMAI